MSDVPCPFCGSRGDEHCTTKSGKNHPSRDAAIAYDALCKAEDTVGSYPGDTTFFCERPRGHLGGHRASHEWTETDALS